MNKDVNCKDGSNTGFWSATKGVFKILGCGINTMASGLEAAAVTMNKMAQEGNDAITLQLAEILKIRQADGSAIEDVHVARLLSEAYSHNDFNRIAAIAQVYELDTSEFVLMQFKLTDIKRLSNLS